MFLEMFINGNGNFVDEGEVSQIDSPLPVFIMFDSGFPSPCSLKETFLYHLGLTMRWSSGPRGGIQIVAQTVNKPWILLFCSASLCPQIQKLISASREALNGFHAG